MRFRVFCLAAVFLAPAGRAWGFDRQSPPPSKEREDTCSVSGMVVKAADGTPLKNAAVRLFIPNDREHTIAAKTNAEGKFELKNLPAGRYRMTVNRNGYVTAEYGQRSANDPGAILTLTPAMTKAGLLFRLVPSAVIAGRVFDEDGEPISDADVTALREKYSDGKRTLAVEAGTSTNDLGEYRL